MLTGLWEDVMWSDAVRVTDFLKRSRRPLLSLSLFLPHTTTCFLREKLLRLADGKDGSPMGVVWRGGVHIVCSTEAQWN